MSDGLKRVLVRGVASLFLLACGPVMLSCSGVSAEEPFYIASESERAGTPGTIIRQEPAVGPPDGATAFRILYRSMGLKGEPIAASALVVIPRGASPEGGRPIVAWAHPTSGVVQKCAPSLARHKFDGIQGLARMIGRGRRE